MGIKMDWIDFKNKPPEYKNLYNNKNRTSDSVLICDKNGNISVAFFEIYCGHHRLEIPFVDGYEYEFEINVEDVLYWMPLPVAPND